MGLWAWIILISVVAAVGVRLLSRAVEVSEGAEGLLRDPKTKTVLGPESDRRLHTAFTGLNEALPFLGAQTFTPSPELPPDEPTDEVDGHTHIRVEPEAPPWTGAAGSPEPYAQESWALEP